MTSNSAPIPLFARPLSAVYDALAPFSYPLIRITAGLLLVPHGAQKLFGWFGGNPERTAVLFEKIGFIPGPFWVTVTGTVEFFCGLLIAIGLLTRPAAVGATILLAVIISVQSGSGWFWTDRGIEFPLLWIAITLAIAVRGGGEWSLDRALGREF